MPGTNGGMVDIYYEIAQRDDGVVNLHDSEVALNSRVTTILREMRDGRESKV